MNYRIVDTNSSFASQITQPNFIYEIRDAFDLQNGTAILGANSILRFIGGSLSNGTLIGANTMIDAIADYEVFNRIALGGTWRGGINDLLFHYDPTEQPTPPIRQDFSPILRNLLLFEIIDLFRKEYFLNWGRIYTNSSNSIQLNGHGAVWYIAGDKGTKNTTQWGSNYDESFLINFADNRRIIQVSDLTIVDNPAISKNPEIYGEQNLYTDQTNYSIFQGLGSLITVFSNVNYDGGGRLHSDYATNIKADKLVYKNCNIYSNGFALEIMCVKTIQNNEETEGHLNEIVIDHCTIHNHFSIFVGPLSFVGEGGIDKLQINHSKICGYPGNLEVFGVNEVYLENSVLVNQGLCSEFNYERPKLFKCSNNSLYLTHDFNGVKTFSTMGKNLYLLNNYFYISSRLNFSNIERLYCFNNTLIVPKSDSNYIFVVDSVKIGYYGNNTVSTPRIYSEHASIRIDTSYVLAQFSPFKIAYNDHVEESIFCYTFNSMKGLTEMTSFPSITTDANGYAKTNGETICLAAVTPVNDTVSFTLIGRSFSYSGVHDLASISVGNFTIKVEQSYGWVFFVTVNNSLVCPVSGAAYDAENQDVRLDITLTQINGSFEVFVFVNGEVKAKYKGTVLSVFSPGAMTVTPNSSTGLRMVRFVPGGNIVDEPQTLITPLIDE